MLTKRSLTIFNPEITSAIILHLFLSKFKLLLIKFESFHEFLDDTAMYSCHQTWNDSVRTHHSSHLHYSCCSRPIDGCRLLISDRV